MIMGILRLIFLREIDYYIHRLFAFYFVIFALVLLFIEAEARSFQKNLMFLSYHSGKCLLNWFLGCMAFFNVNFTDNYWWEYAIGVYIGLVACQQTLMAIIYPGEEKERVERRRKAIEEEDQREAAYEEKRRIAEEEAERKRELDE